MLTPLDPDLQAARYKTSAFLAPYQAYAAAIHEAPAIHHEAVAMALLSVMVGGAVRLHHFGGGDLVGNLWIMLVGGPGTLKSESIRLGERICGGPLKDLRYHDDFSPEKMVADLATRDSHSIIFIQDEAAYLFEQMKKDWQGGLAQLLCKIYDGRPIQQGRQGKEDLLADDYYACFLGAIQPDAFSSHMKDASLRRGLLSRFVWLPATNDPPTGQRVLWDREEETRLSNGLAQIQACAQNCELRLSDAADLVFRDWVRAHHTWAAAASLDLATLGVRFRSLPLKLALLLYLDYHVAHDPTPLTGHITLPPAFLDAACVLALRWRALLPEVFDEFSPTLYSRHYKRVLKYLLAHQPHASHVLLLRNLGGEIKGDEVKQIITQLREARILTPTPCQEKGGTCYHLDDRFVTNPAVALLVPPQNA